MSDVFQSKINSLLKDPKKIVAIVLIVTFLVLLWLGFDIYSNNQKVINETRRSLRIEELNGIILRLDEVLTMSARMAASSGDIFWERRYREHEPELDEAIKESRRLVVETHSDEVARQTDMANQKLVAMENQSFDLVRKGRLEEAQKILFGPEYEKQKKIYAEGLINFAIPEYLGISMEQLRSKIIHYDEILTMSLNMTAATGDTQWKRRYQWYERKLGEVMDEALRLAPDAYSRKLIEETKEFDTALVNMERQVLDLALSGEREQAQTILSSPEYKTDKKKYVEAKDILLSHLYKISHQGLSKSIWRTYNEITLIVSIIFLLLVIWFFVIKAFNRWHIRLKKSNEKLNQQAEALKELNESLDKKVHERTSELRRQHVAALSILEDVKEAREQAEEAEKELQKTHTELRESYEELKQAQMQLLQSEKLASIGQLAAGIAHEINNPIGFISANFQTLEDYAANYTKLLRSTERLKRAIADKDLKKAEDMVDEIEKVEEEVNLSFMMDDIDSLIRESQSGIERIKKIVSDLRTFTREDKDSEAKELLQVETIIDSALNFVKNEIRYKAELKKEFGNVSQIKGNQQRLGQVIINLLINAIHAIEEKGKIEIKTYENEKYVCVDVKDTGKGMSDEVLKNIFDPFYSTKPVGEGTGLGLSISYDIVKQHGGDIRVQSKPGVGTTFSVMLPTSS